MIILSDVDGVLADFIGGVCYGLQRKGFSYTAHDVRSWDLKHTFSDEALACFNEFGNQKGFCKSLRWYRGGKKFLRELEALAEVHAVTAPLSTNTHWMSERAAWLRPTIPVERVHFTAGKYKHMVRGDILIEDHPTTAAQWCKANPKGIAILMDRPWNQPEAKEYVEHRRVLRAKDFEEASRIVAARVLQIAVAA